MYTIKSGGGEGLWISMLNRPPTDILLDVHATDNRPIVGCTSLKRTVSGVTPPSGAGLTIGKKSRHSSTLLRARPAPRAVTLTMYRTLPKGLRSYGGESAGTMNANSNMCTPLLNSMPSSSPPCEMTSRCFDLDRPRFSSLCARGSRRETARPRRSNSSSCTFCASNCSVTCCRSSSVMAPPPRPY